jgi:hypothetical protein
MMHHDYRAILEAAFDLGERSTHFFDTGVAQHMKRRAMARLEKACDDLAVENDGQMVLPDEERDDTLHVEMLTALRHAKAILIRAPNISTSCNDVPGAGLSTTTNKASALVQIALKKVNRADPDAYAKSVAAGTWPGMSDDSY